MARYKVVKCRRLPMALQVKRRVWWGWRVVFLGYSYSEVCDWLDGHLKVPDKDQLVPAPDGGYVHFINHKTD